MKNLFILFIAFLFAACQQSDSNITPSTNLDIESAKENPCIQCTQKIQLELATCLSAAGNDQVKIEACKAKASKDWTAQCMAICNPKINTENALTIEIGKIVKAEKTNKQADTSVHMVSSIDGGVSIKDKDACTSGHIRKITVNGVCYSQMCCGGQWMFFYKDVGARRVWCTCNLGESWTVNCDGNNWIIGCR